MTRASDIGLELLTVNLSPTVRTREAVFDGLAEGTRVSTPKGALRIEGLRPGQTVFAVDPRTGRLEVSEVLLVRSCTRECIDLDVGDEGLCLVPSQPIWSVDRGCFVPAGDLVTARAQRVLVLRGGELRERPVRRAPPYAGLHRVHAVVLASPLHALVAGGLVVRDATAEPTRTR